ncbi:MAG: DUF1295 domain-containing protein [Bacteroidaceae bacterium]|nr:DUF1295 domain-containing protein [Bacteroidaceae bacterium]
MSESLYYHLIAGMAVMALVVFVCLYFVNAGYGQFRTRRWGWSIDNRLGWVLMEAPVFLVMVAIWVGTGFSLHLPELCFLGLFLLHYFHRSFIFPLLLKGKSRMPMAIMLMGITFNVINGVLQGGGLYWFPNPDFGHGAEYLTHWNAVVGVAVFFVGLYINWRSDSIVRHLRRSPADTRHYLPSRGMFRYVTSANYLGEIVEWTGFALAVATPAAWLFVLWTAANLVPRAHAIHKKYRQEFGDDAVGKRKRIFPLLY